MVRVDDVCRVLENLAPLRLAEDWDNVGLLIGMRDDPVESIGTCLTLSADVVERAIDQSLSMVVSHHPLPFRPVKTLTDAPGPGQLVHRLVRGGVAVYSAHTAYDSAAGGINARWAQRLNLKNVRPLRPDEEDPTVGSGRVGLLEHQMPVVDLASLCSPPERSHRVRLTGDPAAMVSKVAIGCGSGGSFLGDAIEHGCDVLLTGEATYHTCLEAAASGVTVVMTGHFDSERFAMEALAENLQKRLPRVAVSVLEESDVVR